MHLFEANRDPINLVFNPKSVVAFKTLTFDRFKLET
jgi:hypothetical protein